MASKATEQRWPPKSPHEALLSSPSGRYKLRRYQDRTSLSPSPLKPTTTPDLKKKTDHGKQILEDEEEDEETLQLRLETLEARLKLKRLQKKKAREAQSSSDVENNDKGSMLESLPKRTDSVRYQPPDGKKTIERQLARSKSSTDIHVPLSPQRKQVAPGESRSPGRVLLGIDKGLKAKNVSLRRAPSSNLHTGSGIDDPSTNYRHSSLKSKSHLLSSRQIVQPKSFSERVAASREHEKDQKERVEKLRRRARAGFGVQQNELDAFISAASQEPDTDGSSKQPGAASADLGDFSREEVLRNFHDPNRALINKSNTFSVLHENRNRSTSLKPSVSFRTDRKKTSIAAKESDDPRIERAQSPASSHHEPFTRSTAPASDSSLFEPFSSLNLSKRILPHTFLARTLTSKKILLVSELLRTVKAPDFSLPEFDSDYVVCAVIASKSTPRNHKDTHKCTNKHDSTSTAEANESEQNTNGKYMVLQLCDLTWEVDLFLFTTAFTRFYKMSPGTVIAILNPSVMPPMPGKADTGRFSLVLNSSDDTVLEIGTSKDMGFCKSVKKDGKVCDAWIDRRKTEFCDWHVDRQIEKTKRGRMEVNTITAPFAPGGRKGSRTGFFGGGWGGSSRRKKCEEFTSNGLRQEGAQYDRPSSSKYFIAPSSLGHGRSAASLMDGENLDMSSRGVGREERTRRRLAEMEKEKEIARKLGEGGTGMGGEYLRMRNSDGAGENRESGTCGRGEDLDAGKLGLLDNQAKDVHLSPIKRKRGAGTMNEPRKKTRFVTAKGIREAGRESLGGPIACVSEPKQRDDVATFQYEDDLDIV